MAWLKFAVVRGVSKWSRVDAQREAGRYVGAARRQSKHTLRDTALCILPHTLFAAATRACLRQPFSFLASALGI